MSQSHAYLAKANDALVSYCRCPVAYMTFPPQMDCPWRGCGWLFTCITCRKAFTFAKAIMVEEPWETLGQRDLKNRSGEEPTSEELGQWVEVMQNLLAGIQPGKEYIYLDGSIIPVTDKNVRFVGWHSQHNLPLIPQVEATRDPSILRTVLANRDYWETHANTRE